MVADGVPYEVKIGSDVINIRDLETRRSVNAPLSQTTDERNYWKDYGMPIYPSDIAQWIKDNRPAFTKAGP